jgi:hypothetical protein
MNGNEESSMQRLLQLLTAMALQMRRSGASSEDVVEEFGIFISDYLGSTKASGPSKWSRLAEFVQAGLRDTIQVGLTDVCPYPLLGP